VADARRESTGAARRIVADANGRGVSGGNPPPESPEQLTARLLAAVGATRHAEAREVLAIGRLSWRLRDDDNLLLGRLESQLLRALQLGAARLRRTGRLRGDARLAPEHAALLAQALADEDGGPIELPVAQTPAAGEAAETDGVSARQLTGQPGAPGLARGPARWIRTVADLAGFQAGDVLVCDAVQPSMTHLVPLASAVVERRGGMLIHGVIVARELGLPCVNGIPGLLDRVRDGDLLTVDGYLGIVTVGAPELDLEVGGALSVDDVDQQ
jgi:pyruvate,water dikinase